MGVKVAMNRRTVFVLGAGASCPYGYPSGARLRELICYEDGFIKHYREYAKADSHKQAVIRDVEQFRDTFAKSHIKSIDLFMSKNPQLAPIGKRIIAFEILRSEKDSRFAEDAQWRHEQLQELRSHDRADVRARYRGVADCIGGDWCSFLYNRLIEGQTETDPLPDLTGDQLAFITFNYDRSLEQFFYESLRSSFTEVPEDRIVESLRNLKIIHIYGQLMPLKWQNPQTGVDYRPQQIDESLLQNAAANIRTIYEQEAGPDVEEARRVLSEASQILILGFGYARENMAILDLPTTISSDCQVYGTAYGLIGEERQRAHASLHNPRKIPQERTVMESGDVDCLMLLRKRF